MLEIIQKIRDSDLVDRFIIDRLIDEESVKFVKVRVFLKNKTLLFIKSFTATNRRKYSYHWQTETGKLIRRWDNAPHGKKRSRIIDHCHVGRVLMPIKAVTMDEVLEQVRQYESSK